MKNFSSRTRGNSLLNYKEGRWVKPVIAIGISLFLLFFLKDIFSIVASSVTIPFYYAKHYVLTSTHTIPSFFRSRMELISEIETITRERDALLGGDARTLQIEKENEELRALFTQGVEEKQVLAGVIGRPPYTPYDTLIVDTGERDGVLVGAPVFYGTGMALGYVRAVRANTSYVTLFSSPEVETTVYIYGPDIFTTAYGEGNGVVRVSIPQGIDVKEGDLVILPSRSAFVLGSVHHIVSTPTEPEQSAYVVLEKPLSSIRVVGIGTTPVTPIDFETGNETVSEFEKARFTIPIPLEYYASTTPVYEGIGTTTP
jgi:cell shape-determining protein MreC